MAKARRAMMPLSCAQRSELADRARVPAGSTSAKRRGAVLADAFVPAQRGTAEAFASACDPTVDVTFIRGRSGL